MGLAIVNMTLNCPVGLQAMLSTIRIGGACRPYLILFPRNPQKSQKVEESYVQPQRACIGCWLS